MGAQHKLIHIFLRWTALVALVVGLLLSVLQARLDQQRQLANVERTVDQLLASAVPSAAMAAYSIDPVLGGSVVEGLTQRSPIASARIVSDFSNVLAQAEIKDPERDGGIRRSLLHWLLGNEYQVSRRLLGPMYQNQPLPVGFLEVTVEPALSGDDFLGRVWLSLVSVMVQTLVLCALLTWIYLRTTLRPVEQIVCDLRDLSHHEPDALRHVTIDTSRYAKEIGYLVQSFNHLIGAAALELSARRQAEEELRLTNEQLEARVDERTRHLHREISDRRAMETALRVSEGRFRDLADVSSDWFWESDHNGQMNIVSDRFLLHTGLALSDVQGKTLADFVTMGVVSVISPSWPELRRQFAHQQNRITFEVAIRTHDGGSMRAVIAGKRFVSATGRVLGYRGTGHDITRQYEDAEKLRLASAEAERANAAKSEFLANMSHELRTPMNAILGFAQLLLLPRVSPLDATQTQYVQHIVDAGDHLLGLINEVLDLARIEAGHLDLSSEPLDLTALAYECADMVAPLAQKKEITLHVNGTALQDGGMPQGTGTPMMALGDRVRLKQIIINLLSNAIKYNHFKGNVWLSLSDNGPSCASIAVEDDGIGIPASHLPKIFDPFHRVSASSHAVEGTGVGLAVTRRLVEAMGGAINVTSSESQGSTFWFTLPRLSVEAITSWAPAGSQRTSAWWSSEMAFLAQAAPMTVLYVEDNPANQSLMANLLAMIDTVTLEIKSTGSEGLEWARSHHADLVLLDINLPDMTGDRVAQELRLLPEYTEALIVAVSANARAQDITQARGSGFDDYLCKPFDVGDVVAHLVRACRRKAMVVV